MTWKTIWRNKGICSASQSHPPVLDWNQKRTKLWRTLTKNTQIYKKKYTNRYRYTTTANTDIHTRKFEDTNTCTSTVLVETFLSHPSKIVLVFMVLHIYIYIYTNYSSLINDKDTEFAAIPHR